MHNSVTSNTSSSNIEVHEGTSKSDESSNSDETSNADDSTQSNGSSENNIENTLSGGASVETQENSFEDTTDAGGASSSRQHLPPFRSGLKIIHLN